MWKTVVGAYLLTELIKKMFKIVTAETKSTIHMFLHVYTSISEVGRLRFSYIQNWTNCSTELYTELQKGSPKNALPMKYSGLFSCLTFE